MKNLLVLFGLIIFVICFQNCGPIEDTRPVYEIDQTTIDYCVYDKGNWWVYEEESSGERDTIVVTLVKNSIDSNKHLHYKRKGYFSIYSTKMYIQTSSWTGPSYNMPELCNSSESFVISPHGYIDFLFISTLDTSFTYVLTNVEQMKLKDIIASVKIKDTCST
jgi:hypothetical protein